MKERLSILHTEWSRGWGGQEIRIISESLALMDKGHLVRIACRPGSPIMKAAALKGIEVVGFPFLSALDVRTILSLAAYLKREHVDIVHTHSSVDSWSGAVAARLAGKPVVRSRHLGAPIETSLLAWVLYMVLAHRIIASGKIIKDRMVAVNGYDPARIVSVPAGADEARFHPGVDPKPVRDEFGLTPEAFVVGIVAVLRSLKGHEDLLEAVARLRAHATSLKLLVVGDGPHRAALLKRTRELRIEDAVIFTGFREDVPSLLAAMDVFVLPSRKNEGTPQVIPQAMLMGIPVIATTAGGVSEVVDHNRTGILVPPQDPDAIVRAVLDLRASPRRAKAMAAAAREKALQNWTFRGMIEKTEAVYLSVVRGNAGKPRAVPPSGMPRTWNRSYKEPPEMTIRRELLDILACPRCKGELDLANSGEELRCAACGVRYEIDDGIPVLLVDKAKPLTD